jgi:hypothetical protein
MNRLYCICIILVNLIATIKTNANNQFRDSLVQSSSFKKKTYLILTPGFVSIKDNYNTIGNATALKLDLERFVYNKVSLNTRIGFNHSYLKYNNSTLDYIIGASVRKYIKAKKSCRFFIYSALTFGYQTQKDLVVQKTSYNRGFTNSNGIGFSSMPYLKKKKSLSKIGFDVSISLLNAHSQIISIYNTIGIKFILN